MNYFSLFTGIGGFELGIQQAYENIGNQQSSQIKQNRKRGDRTVSKVGNNVLSTSGFTPLCIGYSEIDKYAIQIYEKHFTAKNYGDITRINAEGLPTFELLCGGFPCQSFSIAGKRGGFEDTRGTLFFDIARIIKVKRPRLIFLENVKGLLSHDEGRTFNTIILTLDELGYDLQWQVLNSKNFGVPQNRERVFIIGHIRGTPRPKVFPFKGTNKANGKRVNIVAHRDIYRRNRQTFDPNGLTEALDTAQGGGRGHHVAIPILTPDRPKTAMDRNGVVIDMEVANTLTPDAYLTRGERKRVNGKAVLTSMYERRIRRLTPTECERLQGFPVGWTEGLSDTQRYKCLGNAVTVNVIKEIAKKLYG